MVLVRNTFQVKFGRMREAVGAWKEMREVARKAPGVRDFRLLTDVTGQAYTLVAEFTYGSMAEFEKGAKDIMATPEWQAWYQKVIPVMDSSSREIFNIVE